MKRVKEQYFRSNFHFCRALHHLSRLKVLVEEPRENHRGEEEEKDDDEGHYSSSSTEGLVSAHQNAS